MPGASAIKAGSAFVLLSIKDSLTRDLQAAQGKLDSFTSSAGSKLQNALAAAAPLAKSAQVFSDFDDQMRLVQGVTGSTGEQFAALTETAKELGRTTSWTAAQVAEGMTSLGRAGFKSDEINASIGSVMNLARATGTEIGAATDIAGNALRAFNLPASEMARVCDVLAATANGSAQTLEDLGEAFKYVAPIAASTGESLEDTAKTVGALANFGVKGSQAGTVIKAIQTRMASDAGAQATYAELGIDTRDAEGNLRKVHDVLADLGAALQNMPSGERLEKIKSVFGQYGLSGVSLTTSDFKELNAAIEGSTGTAARVAEAMDAGIGGAARKAKSAVEGLSIAIGDALAPHITELTGAIQEASGWLTRFSEEHPQTVKWIGRLASAFVGLSGAAYAGGKAVSALVSVFRAGSAAVEGLAGLIKKFVGATQAASAASTALAASETQVAAASNASAAAQTRTAAAANAARTATLARVAALAGIAAAVVGAVAALEYYCGAEARASKAAEKASAAAAERVRKGEEEAERSKELFARLEELGSRSELTNAEFEEGKIIAEQLQQTYGDLGIVVDESARKFGNLTTAANQFNEALAAQSVKDKEFQIRQEKAEAEALEREYDSYMNKSVKGWWKEFKGVFSGEGVAERAEEIQARLREIQHNRQKLQNEIDLTKARNANLQDESYFERRQARAEMQRYREATRLPSNVRVEYAVPPTPQVNVQPASASDPAALAELQKQTEESRRQTAALRQIMTNTTPEDPNSDYF